MNSLRSKLAQPQALLLLVAGLLLFPALLTNLGLLALYGDEGIRAQVAMEMDISGNLISPTLFGELYYNKPPLYNWLLLALFKLTGRTDEFMVRLPTVIFLLAYVATIYFIVKKHLQPNNHSPQSAIRNPQSAILNALAFLTCGRILYYDSMLGLIDTSFSWVIYGMFMVIYSQGEKEKYGRLFVGAYFLAAVGFMLKALPAVVFLGVALLTYFIWTKKWRKLFSLAHLGGMAVFGALVGSYYALYAQQNGISKLLGIMFDESAKRTFVEHGVGKTVLHLFTFPFEMLYHFLPWTLLAVYFFRKNVFAQIRANRFVTWNALVLMTTILPYWASVEVYPRYLLMHVPLLFTVLLFLHQKNKEAGTAMLRWIEGIFQVGCWALLGACFVPLFVEKFAQQPNLYPKVAFLAISTAALIWCYRNWQAQRMLVFTIVLLVGRIGMNWFIVPTRIAADFNNEVRKTTLAATEKIGNTPIFIYKNSLGFQPVTGYYFTRETGSILKKQFAGHFDPNNFYLMDTTQYTRQHDVVAKVRLMWQHGELAVVKIK
ncbi:MAG: glycosyltransferase family 39 protein [Saprospiraceae bacterium]|nr:glycosyltransferase family 39 protein [Saprospiraceae bacterium]